MVDSPAPLRLRVGRSQGRTLYRLHPDGTDELIGLVDTRELAAQIVAAVNAAADRDGEAETQEQGF